MKDKEKDLAEMARSELLYLLTSGR